MNTKIMNFHSPVLMVVTRFLKDLKKWVCLPLDRYWTITTLGVPDGANNLKKPNFFACRWVVFLVAAKLKAFL